MATSRDKNIETYFPALQSTGYTVTSPQTTTYNCIAWSLGLNNRWFWPDKGGQYYWPDEIPREANVEAFALCFSKLGFEESDNPSLEKSYEKVALFVDNQSNPTHAARQLPNGMWTSKLGRENDIEHNDLDGICGDYYGKVFKIFKRKVK